jgi:hypothetical protein
MNVSRGGYAANLYITLTRGQSAGAENLVGRVLLHYAGQVDPEEEWSNEAILREAEHWVYVSSDSAQVEDERRLLVHWPER